MHFKELPTINRSTLGHYCVQTFTNYGIPNNNYWDWQAGFVVTLYGFDFTAAYTGTNLSVQDCLGTQNCASRVIVSGGPDDLRKAIQAEFEKTGKLIKELGITVPVVSQR